MGPIANVKVYGGSILSGFRKKMQKMLEAAILMVQLLYVLWDTVWVPKKCQSHFKGMCARFSVPTHPSVCASCASRRGGTDAMGEISSGSTHFTDRQHRRGDLVADGSREAVLPKGEGCRDRAGPDVRRDVMPETSLAFERVISTSAPPRDVLACGPVHTAVIQSSHRSHRS